MTTAGIGKAVTPHTLRHAFITAAQGWRWRRCRPRPGTPRSSPPGPTCAGAALAVTPAREGYPLSPASATVVPRPRPGRCPPSIAASSSPRCSAGSPGCWSPSWSRSSISGSPKTHAPPDPAHVGAPPARLRRLPHPHQRRAHARLPSDRSVADRTGPACRRHCRRWPAVPPQHAGRQRLSTTLLLPLGGI
jgi:hypothetical protein